MIDSVKMKGMLVSRIGIGTWAIGGGWGPQPEAQSLATLHTALEMGCQLIDTAALYGNGHAEELIASVLQSVGQRVTTLTKVYPLAYSWSPLIGTPIQTIYPSRHIVTQAEESIRRLKTDCLDCLLLQTWCPSWGEETEWYQTMLDLQQSGKIRTFGISVSDHRPEEANDVIRAGRVSIIEASYSILDQRATETLFPVAQQYGTSIIARSPLASGALSGTWYQGMKFHCSDWRKRVFRGDVLTRTIERVEQLKASIDVPYPLAQLALRFCLSHPAITAVIPGVRNVEQVTCNFSTAKEPLSQDTLDSIRSLWTEEFYKDVRTSIGGEE